jgi:DNA-binding transcriptional ArsR family regulator
VVTKENETNFVLEALGNRTRRDILDMLRESDMPVGDIAARLPISRPAVSKHLRILESAGLVAHQSSGTSNIFRIKYQGFEVARHYLDSFWSEALHNFKQTAENQKQGTK